MYYVNPNFINPHCTVLETGFEPVLFKTTSKAFFSCCWLTTTGGPKERWPLLGDLTFFIVITLYQQQHYSFSTQTEICTEPKVQNDSSANTSTKRCVYLLIANLFITKILSYTVSQDSLICRCKPVQGVIFRHADLHVKAFLLTLNS